MTVSKKPPKPNSVRYWREEAERLREERDEAQEDWRVAHRLAKSEAERVERLREALERILPLIVKGLGEDEEYEWELAQARDIVRAALDQERDESKPGIHHFNPEAFAEAVDRLVEQNEQVSDPERGE